MKEYVDTAVKALSQPTLEVAKQYLAVISLESDTAGYVVDRIAEDEESVLVYFKVRRERFFLVVKLGKHSGEVEWLYPESGNDCYLTCTSETLTLEDLSKFVKLPHFSGFDKNDLKLSSTQTYGFSRINYKYTDKESFDTESAIRNLLDYLDREKSGFLRLIGETNACISINKHQYVSGNAGLHLDLETLRRVSEYGLSIDIDTYIVGKELDD